MGCLALIHWWRELSFTLLLPRVIKFPLQPHQKYYITQYGELGFSSLTQIPAGRSVYSRHEVDMLSAFCRGLSKYECRPVTAFDVFASFEQCAREIWVPEQKSGSARVMVGVGRSPTLGGRGWGWLLSYWSHESDAPVSLLFFFSWRQATIKLKSDGEYCVLNEGRRALYIDGRPVETGVKATLYHNSTFEVSQRASLPAAIGSTSRARGGGGGGGGGGNKTVQRMLFLEASRGLERKIITLVEGTLSNLCSAGFWRIVTQPKTVRKGKARFAKSHRKPHV